jgi:hypothetical protein
MLACSAQAQVTFREHVRLVTAPTIVFSQDGRILTDLRTPDFHLFDNDRPQKISMEPATSAISVAVVVQRNLDVRAYVPFITKVGSVVESLLVGDGGDSALLSYGDEVKTLKPFGSGDLQLELRKLTAWGLRARFIDAGMQAIRLLKERPPTQARVLLFIGQPMDDGSESKLDALKEDAARENITVFALALPEIGKNFVSDNFKLDNLDSRSERGGFKVSMDLLKVIQVISRATDASANADPFAALTAATAGTVFHFRKQPELEGTLAAVGVQLRSTYLLSYYANSEEPGKHAIRVEVNVPGAKVRTRPGW